MEIRDLSVEFHTAQKSVRALRSVSIDVPEKKALGVVGESGSGKSTVIWAALRLLAGNAVVKSGEVRFKGEDILAFSQRELELYRGEQVSVVFQDPMTSQIPVMTYGRQMSDIQYRRKAFSAAEKRQLAINMMRRVGIPDPERRVDQYPHQFSGGMRQRASIAMALLMNPSLLIADEPTTALDVTMEAQIIHLMHMLKEETGSTLIVVSHNLGLIAELCDEVVVMYAGEVVEHGDVHQIFGDPQHPYTRALLECDPARVARRTRTLPAIPGEVPDLSEAPKACMFAPRCPKAFALCSKESPQYIETETGQGARCHLLRPDHNGLSSFANANAAAKVNEPPLTTETPAPPSLTPPTDSLLEVEALGVRFRTMGTIGAFLSGETFPYVEAVLDVSLALRPGETLGIVGESGSGKTTLGRAILGLIEAHSGSVTFDGRSLAEISKSELMSLRSDMAMMFQDPVGSLSPRKTVRSLIVEPFDIHGFDGRNRQAEAERLCRMVGLPLDLLGRYPHELSGGQARRVGVARALALEPRLIIADEPTAGLDVSVQGDVLNLMTRLQRDHGLAFIIITHNLPVVRHISDHLAIMYFGRIVEQGGNEAIFTQPAHPYTAALINGVPQPDPSKRRRLVSIEGEVPSLANRPSGCEFHSRCPYVQSRCRTEAPPLRPISAGRRVRCHFPLVE